MLVLFITQITPHHMLIHYDTLRQLHMMKTLEATLVEIRPGYYDILHILEDTLLQRPATWLPADRQLLRHAFGYLPLRRRYAIDATPHPPM